MESAPRDFSLTRGGPFFHVLRRLRIWPAQGKPHFWRFGFLVWLPIAIGEGVRFAMGHEADPTFFDLSLHARVLFTLPIMLYAERLLDGNVASSIRSLYNGHFCDGSRIDRIVDAAERMRDSRRVELLLAATAILGGQLALWNVYGASGWIHGGQGVTSWPFPQVWYAIVALPIVQFVMFRWLWRWLIWTYAVFRLSRVRLYLIATHPDYACGLAALTRPMTGFSGFVLAISGLLAAAWGTQVLHGYTTLRPLLPMLVAFLLLSLAVAVLPLLPLSRHLFTARRKSLAEYGDFARRFDMHFHRKWIDARDDASHEIMTAPDPSALHDFSESFAVISKTRPFVFGPRHVLTVWTAGFVPMVPLFASALTVEQVLRRIIATVLGGFQI